MRCQIWYHYLSLILYNVPTSWYVVHLHPITQKDGYCRHMNQVHADLLEDEKAFIPEQYIRAILQYV